MCAKTAAQRRSPFSPSSNSKRGSGRSPVTAHGSPADGDLQRGIVPTSLVVCISPAQLWESDTPQCRLKTAVRILGSRFSHRGSIWTRQRAPLIPVAFLMRRAQQELEISTRQDVFVDSSVSDSIRTCIAMGNHKAAQKLRVDFKVSPPARPPSAPYFTRNRFLLCQSPERRTRREQIRATRAKHR